MCSKTVLQIHLRSHICQYPVKYPSVKSSPGRGFGHLFCCELCSQIEMLFLFSESWVTTLLPFLAFFEKYARVWRGFTVAWNDNYHTHTKFCSPTVYGEAFATLLSHSDCSCRLGKMLWKLQFRQLFRQLMGERKQKSCFICFLFSMPTVTVKFSPRSDLGCALALWGLQEIKKFSCKLTYLLVLFNSFCWTFCEALWSE